MPEPKDKNARESAWLDRIESRQSRFITPTDEECLVFQRDMTREDQLALVERVVTERAAELCRSFQSVFSIDIGFKRLGTDAASDRKIPCIAFEVREKWIAKDSGDPDQCIPSHLLAIWQAPWGATRVGIPTKVTDGQARAKIRPHQAPRPVVASAQGAGDEHGVITCALTRDGDDQLYFLSCRHLLSLITQFYPDQTWNVDIDVDGGSARLGQSSLIAGRMRNAPGFSHDAQLGIVKDRSALLRALGSTAYEGRITSRNHVPNVYYVLTPDGAVEVELETFRDAFAIDYGIDGLEDVQHEILIESRCPTGALLPGHSGSPVMTHRHGGDLIGMHIAGDMQNRALAIPAWRLFRPKDYVSTAQGEHWSLEGFDDVERPGGVDVHTTMSPTRSLHVDPAVLIDHQYLDSVTWRLAADGIRIDNAAPEITNGPPTTVERVWHAFGASFSRWCRHYGVPLELAIATACTETSGRAGAVRQEPGYVSDDATPHKISVGLMQTLISTARETLSDPEIDRAWLLKPDNSIRAGIAYIARQKAKTDFDPPKVACAYNAGGIYPNNKPGNRWRMRQYPLGTGEHADRFVKWLNDCFRYFDVADEIDEMSLRNLFRP